MAHPELYHFISAMAVGALVGRGLCDALKRDWLQAVWSGGIGLVGTCLLFGVWP